MREGDSTEEFRIVGTKKGKERVWTRDSFLGAKGLAENLAENHEYDKVIIVNTFGGDISAPLFMFERKCDCGCNTTF